MRDGFETYREELDRVRLTEESRRALAESLSRRSPRPFRPKLRLAVVAAAVLCLLATVGGAVVVSNVPTMRDRFFGGDSVGYQQSGAFVGKAVENDGWTLSITDCVGDDHYVYLGLELEAPEGTVLDAVDYDFRSSVATFADSSLYGSWQIVALPDEDPSDNKIPLMWLLYSVKPGMNGASVHLRVFDLGHNWRTVPDRRGLDCDMDCAGRWDFGYVTIEYPDNILRLEPNTPVKAILPGPEGDRAVDAVVSEIQISPLALYVRISGEALVLHHGAVKGDRHFDCWDAQTVAVYDAEGGVVETTHGLEMARWTSGNLSKSSAMGGGGCSWYHETEGYLWLVFGYSGLMDVNQIATVEVNGVTIPVR